MNMLNGIILLISTLFLTEELYSQSDIIIYAGKGVNSLEIGKSKIQDVRKTFGNDYLMQTIKSVRPHWYGKSFFYKLFHKSKIVIAKIMRYDSKGIVVYCNHKDSTVTSILFYELSKASTSKGLRISEHTVKEVYDKYGEKRLMQITGEDYYLVDYEGIRFHFEKKDSIPIHEKAKEDYIDNILIHIWVYKGSSPW